MAFKSKKHAQQHCDKIQAVLGDGWTPDVWNNLGWHCCWIKGAAYLSYSPHSKTYSVLVGDLGSRSGRPELCGDVPHHDDPIKAVAAACKYALEIINTEWMPIKASVEELAEIR